MFHQAEQSKIFAGTKLLSKQQESHLGIGVHLGETFG